MSLKKIAVSLGLVVSLVVPSIASAAPEFAVWLDGSSTDGGNGITSSLTNAFGAGSYSLVSTADLETPGFLNAFKTVIVSRFDSGFGNPLSALAAANIAAYVGSGPTQGAVALFTNDAADNFFGATTGDVFDPNLDKLFTNAAGFALASGHGYIGEFNGAVMAMASNSVGWPAMDLLPGNAAALGGTSGSNGHFIYDVGPVGSSNPIDAGLTFPFTDLDDTLFRTDVTGASPSNIVDVYDDNGLPAVLANGAAGVNPTATPEPATLLLMGIGIVGAAFTRRLAKHS